MSTDLHERLVEAAGGDFGEPDLADGWRRGQRLRRLRLTRRLTLTAVVVLAVGGVGTHLLSSNGPAQVSAGLGRPEGSWQKLPPAPIDGRWSAYTVWTGQEMLIWAGHDETQTQTTDGPVTVGGQRDDGAAYNPTTRKWRRLPTAPFAITNAVNPVVVWTGTEMIVFGARTTTSNGVVVPSQSENAALAYNPTTNRWRVLATPPPGLDLLQASAVWAGHQALIMGWTTPTGAPVVGTGLTAQEGPNASYDPTTNTWKLIAPSPLGPLQYETLAWTGQEMIAWGGTSPATGPPTTNEGAAYDPHTNAWRILPQAPIARRSAAGAAWSGHQLLIWGGSLGTANLGDGAAYEPGTNRWHLVAPGDLPPSVPNTTLWTGRQLLIIGGTISRVVNGSSVDQPSPASAAYSPATNTWTPLPAEPTPFCGASSAVWTGRMAILWGGNQCTPATQYPDVPIPSTNRGVAYTP